VTLFLARVCPLRVAVSNRPALWCPDFPHLKRVQARPSGANFGGSLNLLFVLEVRFDSGQLKPHQTEQQKPTLRHHNPMHP